MTCLPIEYGKGDGMVGLQKIVTSALLADFPNGPLDLHTLMTQAARGRGVGGKGGWGKEEEDPKAGSGQQPVRN